MISAKDALERLKSGNQRFVQNIQKGVATVDIIPPANLSDRQQPFATILGCADSRVPAEIVFNQGLGDLFVIRVAGNIIAPSLVGSVEFAAARCNTKLVVVLGHSNCGAVQATLETLLDEAHAISPNLKSIVNRILPVVEPLTHTDLIGNREALMKESVRANIKSSVNHLRHGSKILEDLISQGEVQVVGAEYCLETGSVEFLDI
jgi:carbonic anhydrase